ncbi:MAG: hypothetical protein KAR85_06395 [Methanosarcinales archaeon]|nr:hypothetical protein [Methanosarcinales archaeon]
MALECRKTGGERTIRFNFNGHSHFDIVLTIVANTLYRLLAKELKRFEE